MSTSAIIILASLLTGLAISIARKHLVSIFATVTYSVSAIAIISTDLEQVVQIALIPVVFTPFFLAFRNARVPEGDIRSQVYAIGLFLTFGTYWLFRFNHWPGTAIISISSMWTVPYLLIPKNFKSIIQSRQFGVFLFLQVDLVMNFARIFG
ncbi:hypothetical protein [Sanyastnella coralliicola]|uniref:hypothetical protein n=1 Tax=Sanyastnella coralliicola TaxID=3069118 RepID=UPI0027B987AC|nr:hypothetical protein [Longitalea sp. SCSIO 12813]